MEKIKLIVTKPFLPEHIERLYNTENYDIEYSADLSGTALQTAQAILGMPQPEKLKNAANLKWIQLTSAGNEEYISAADCIPENTVITNLSGAFGRSMSEFALAMVLNFYKHLHLYRDNQNSAVWRDEGRQMSLRNKNVLFLGAGNIATEAALLFKAFECGITAIRRNAGCEAAYPFDRFCTLESIENELPKADIVICALPDTDKTRGVLNKERLALLKKDAVLINLGRGSLIDTDALTELLNSNAILGAALDVTSPEPLPADHPLWKCKNAIITPHITGGSLGHLDETEKRLFDICSENLKRFAAGEPLKNKVDFKAGYRQTENRV